MPICLPIRLPKRFSQQQQGQLKLYDFLPQIQEENVSKNKDANMFANKFANKSAKILPVLSPRARAEA